MQLQSQDVEPSDLNRQHQVPTETTISSHLFPAAAGRYFQASFESPDQPHHMHLTAEIEGANKLISEHRLRF